jgi:tetratricopeptide (TPR) repeat protein
MTTAKSTIYLLFLTLIACGQKDMVDSEARKLNDSAVALTMKSFDSSAYADAILLLDKATAIDSNYYTAYWNKYSFQWTLKQYDKALVTAKHLNRIKPDAPDYYVSIGLLYEKLGDTVSARQHFKDALVRYNNILDTMDSKNKNYDNLLINKAVNLIFAGQQTEGNEMLKQLYEKHKDDMYAQAIEMFMNKSRQEIIDGFNQTEK